MSCLTSHTLARLWRSGRLSSFQFSSERPKLYHRRPSNVYVTLAMSICHHNTSSSEAQPVSSWLLQHMALGGCTSSTAFQINQSNRQRTEVERLEGSHRNLAPIPRSFYPTSWGARHLRADANTRPRTGQNSKHRWEAESHSTWSQSDKQDAW
jgi:hypothetical protein